MLRVKDCLSIMIGVVLIFSLFFPLLIDNVSAATTEEESIVFTFVGAPGNLTLGQDFEVAASIKNVRENAVNDIFLTISVPEGLALLTDTTVQIQSLTPGGSTTARWTLRAESVGSHEVTVSFTSSDGGSNSYSITVNISKPGELVFTFVGAPGNLTLGQDFEVAASIKNVRENAVNDIFLTISVPEGLALLTDTTVQISQISGGNSTSAKWTLMAEKLGSYKITVDFTSSDGGSGAASLIVNIHEPTGPILEVTDVFWGVERSKTVNAKPGSVHLPLTVEITNSGDTDAIDIVGTLVLDEPFYYGGNNLLENIIFRGGTIPPSQSSSFVYYLSIGDSASPGAYYLNLNLTFSDGYTSFEITKSIPITVVTVPHFDISITQSEAQPGDVLSIFLTAKNIGEVTAQDVTVSIVDSPIFTPFEQPLYLGNIKPDSSGTANFSVGVSKNIVEGIYPVNFSLSYSIGLANYREIYSVGVTVSGEPSFVIQSVEVDPAIVYAGDRGVRLRINLMNIGYAVAKNVTIVIEPSQGISPSWGGGNKVSIGSISPEQTVSADFYLNVDEKIWAEAYYLDATITYNGYKSFQTNVPFLVSPKAYFSLISVEAKNLYPGSLNVPITVLISNNGSATSYSTSAKLIAGNLFPGLTVPGTTTIGNVDFLGSVSPGQTVIATFLISTDTSVKPGDYVANIEMNWQQGEESFSQTLPLPLVVSKEPYKVSTGIGNIPLSLIIALPVIAILIAAYFIVRGKRRREIEAEK